MVFRLVCTIILPFAVLVPKFAVANSALNASKDCPREGEPKITRALCAIRSKHDVPAMAAALVTSQGLQSVGVVGVRKAGEDAAVTAQDLWHLGSDTKAMTATLIARLVERDKLQWDTTVSEIFPELASNFQAPFRKVTLKHLLSHQAGVESNLNWSKLGKSGILIEQRLAAVKEGLSKNPKHAPGSKFLYSNLGYVIAGAMVERVTGKTWEDMMRKEVFEPLGMKSAGFGGIGTPGFLDQPWGHLKADQPAAVYGRRADNPAVLGPAGTVHCTIQDWARFITDQLQGFRGNAGLLKPETYKELMKPPFGGGYALGWGVLERPWGKGLVLNHCGCNTMYFANVWIAPQGDFAILVTANLGLSAFDATDEAVQALLPLCVSHSSPTSEPEAPGR